MLLTLKTCPRFDSRPRKRIALTVSQADSIPETYQPPKRIDQFIKIGKELPDIEFHVVGVRGLVAEKAKQDSQGIPNVTIRPGRVPLDDLLEEFWNASAYCQLSARGTLQGIRGRSYELRVYTCYLSSKRPSKRWWEIADML